MRTLTITEARKKFMALPDQADEEQVLAVTRRNKKVMAVMSWDLYEGLLETVEILSDPELMKFVKASIEDIKAERTHSLSDAYERLGL